MADIDDNPEDLTLAEAISYLAFDCLLAKEDLAARQEVHSDRSEVQSAKVAEMLDTMLPGEELPKGLKPEEEKKRRGKLKQEEARKTRLYGGAKLDWIYSRKGDWLVFTPDDAAKIDDACNRLVRWMIDEKVTGTGRLKKDDELNDERQNIPSGFLRSGVHVKPLSDSIDEDILLPGNFGRPLKGYRYVQINRAELVAEVPQSPVDEVSQPDDEAPKAKVGRPSHRKEIQEAYQELVKINEIDFDGPKTATYEPIRQKVRRVLRDKVTGGLGDEAIRVVIAPLFDHDKVARSKRRDPSPATRKFSQKL